MRGGELERSLLYMFPWARSCGSSQGFFSVFSRGGTSFHPEIFQLLHHLCQGETRHVHPAGGVGQGRDVIGHVGDKGSELTRNSLNGALRGQTCRLV
jgi:hypothetical protein